MQWTYFTDSMKHKERHLANLLTMVSEVQSGFLAWCRGVVAIRTDYISDMDVGHYLCQKD